MAKVKQDVWVVVEYSYPEFDEDGEFEDIVGVYSKEYDAFQAMNDASKIREVYKTTLEWEDDDEEEKEIDVAN